MAHHQAVRLHGVEILHRVQEGFAFFQTGSFRLQVHGVRTETRGGSAKADARARGIFEESKSNRFAAEGSQFFQGVALDFLERPALIEEKS